MFGLEKQVQVSLQTKIPGSVHAGESSSDAVPVTLQRPVFKRDALETSVTIISFNKSHQANDWDTSRSNADYFTP